MSKKRKYPSEYRTHEYRINLNTGQYGCPVFKWLSHVTWRIIWIPYILDHKQAFFSPDFGPPFEYRTFWTINRLFSVQFLDHHLNTEPFDNWTQIYHFDTRLVQYSDGYCMEQNLIFNSLTQLNNKISLCKSALKNKFLQLC